MFKRIKDLFLDWMNHNRLFLKVEIVFFVICLISNIFSIFALHNNFVDFVEGIGFAFLFLFSIFLMWFGASLLLKHGTDVRLDNLQQGVALGALVIGIIIIAVIVIMFSMQSQYMIYGK